MKQTIKNIPTINPAEIIKKVSTLDQFGRGEEWHGTITAEQFATLSTAVKDAGGEVVESRKYVPENCEACRRSCAGLEVSGFSQLVDLFDAGCYWDSNNQRVKCYTDHIKPYLIINNRAYFVPCYGNEKPGTTFELFLPHFDPERVDVSYNGGWKFDKPAPSKVGKATVKKLTAWVDWLDRQNASRAAWIKNGADAQAALFARLDASGVEYKQFRNTVTIYNGILKIEMEIGEHDVYCRSVSLNLSGIKNPTWSDGLSLILDHEIIITPKY